MTENTRKELHEQIDDIVISLNTATQTFVRGMEVPDIHMRNSNKETKETLLHVGSEMFAENIQRLLLLIERLKSEVILYDYSTVQQEQQTVWKEKEKERAQFIEEMEEKLVALQESQENFSKVKKEAKNF